MLGTNFSLMEDIEALETYPYMISADGLETRECLRISHENQNFEIKQERLMVLWTP